MRSKRLFWAISLALTMNSALVFGDSKATVITAKDGILYQNGTPCFLAGVWSDAGYWMGFSVNQYSPVELKMAPGREGNGLKISFPAIEKCAGSRWVDFPGFDPALCVNNRIRIRYGTVDMGAYETIYEGTLYEVR